MPVCLVPAPEIICFTPTISRAFSPLISVLHHIIPRKESDMVKDKKQNKKRKLNGRVNEAKPVASLPTPPGDISSSSSLIEPEELETAIYTLRTLCGFPEELSDKKYKELKRSLYDLHRVMADGATLGMWNAVLVSINLIKSLLIMNIRRFPYLQNLRSSAGLPI